MILLAEWGGEQKVACGPVVMHWPGHAGTQTSKGAPKEGVWHFQEARLRRQQKVRHHLGSRTAFDAIKRSAVPKPKKCVLKCSAGGSFRRLGGLSVAFRRFPRLSVAFRALSAPPFPSLPRAFRAHVSALLLAAHVPLLAVVDRGFRARGYAPLPRFPAMMPPTMNTCCSKPNCNENDADGSDADMMAEMV